MKALIKPNEYFQKEIFEKENAKLFSQIWNFVGFTSDFSEVNDFIVSNISGIPIVIQNLKGEIKAFKNVCSHRHSLIQTAKKGNRPLMCPYHGWSYNHEGIPTGIPKKPLFNFTKEELECLRLDEYSIETCGTLVFLKLELDSTSLQEHLGDFYGEVEKMSENFGKLVDVNEIEINCNWKIVVENTLESYHVALIHSQTFRKLGATGLNFKFSRDHSCWDADLFFKENDGKQEKVHKSFQSRKYVIDGYKHLILFPNILISTTYGISFNLSHVIPIDEKTTLFKSYVFISKKELKDNISPIELMYESSLVDFNRKVFDEDKEICQFVQKGINFSSYDGELSKEEARVLHFQERYKDYLI